MYVVFSIHNSDPHKTLSLIGDKVSLEYYEGISDNPEHLVVAEAQAPGLEALLVEHGLEYTKHKAADIPSAAQLLDFFERLIHPSLSEPSDDQASPDHPHP